MCTLIVPELFTNDAENHSTSRSNVPFGGDIRFLSSSFQNENEPQRPPCGRQIAALLGVRDSDAALSFYDRQENNYLHSLTHRVPVIANAAQRRML